MLLLRETATHYAQLAQLGGGILQNPSN